jgi:hypothetical protein
VYHHTPQTPYFSQSPWVVLEYASRDRKRGIATLFRTSSFEGPVYRFVPRGIDVADTYKVTFQNRGETVELSGAQLLQQGISIRLETPGTSEMLLFESETVGSKNR